MYLLFRERKAPLWKLPDIFWRAWLKLNAIDCVEKASHDIRTFEIDKGETTTVFRQCMEILDAAQSKIEIKEATDASLELLSAIPQDRSRDPIKIGLIGEIYVVLEPLANHNVQVKLEKWAFWCTVYLSVDGPKTMPSLTENMMLENGEPFLSELVGAWAKQHW